MDDPEPEAELERAALMSTAGTTYVADRSYKGAHYDHFAHFFNAIRGREPSVVEDAVFGYRAAAPALACNLSYYEKRAVGWET